METKQPHDAPPHGVPEDEEVLVNKDPAVVTWAVNAVVETVQQYGWFVLLAMIAVYFLYQKFKPSLNQWRSQKEQDSYKKLDSGVALSRMEAMEKARQKMQDQMDAQAKVFAEKQEQKETQKREERLQDWDRHQQGRGYRSKTKTPDATPTSSKLNSSSKAKKPLREGYNPLMGDQGGACFRPPRRGGAAGGG